MKQSDKLKIGITGSQGFIGWHMSCFFSTLPNIEVVTADRGTFLNQKTLKEFVYESDAIVHLAGVNRASEEEIYRGNIGLTTDLINACIDSGRVPHILFASSTHAENPKTIYGQAKQQASQLLEKWAEKNDATYTQMIIPHVFGEYGRPNYNSVIATFCNQLTQGMLPGVTGDGHLELIHVQDLCDEVNRLIVCKISGTERIHGQPISVIDVADKLSELWGTYQSGVVPCLNEPFTLSLFNTLRGAIPDGFRQIYAKRYEDDRGWLVETVKVESGGQSFVSSTRLAVTRGDHFHRRKFERFFVLQGKAKIRLRKLFSTQVEKYFLDGAKPSFVDIPTLYTHNITNIGKCELITLFWSHEIFDPKNPDTYGEYV